MSSSLDADRTKERLVQVLEDRELSFVCPMLKVESALFEKISSDVSGFELRQWIEANVGAEVAASSTAFIHSLVTSVIKNAAEKSVLGEHHTTTTTTPTNATTTSEGSSTDNTATKTSRSTTKMDKVHVAKQKQLIENYACVLRDYLRGNRPKQVEAIYAIQLYAESKGFPKYFLAHLFNQMYDLELVDEEAFYMWKDEINDNYPNKGQALFHVIMKLLHESCSTLFLPIDYDFCYSFFSLQKTATEVVQLAARGTRRVEQQRFGRKVLQAQTALGSQCQQRQAASPAQFASYYKRNS